eukprot:5407020-Amphidinium_carterae.1
MHVPPISWVVNPVPVKTVVVAVVTVSVQSGAGAGVGAGAPALHWEYQGLPNTQPVPATQHVGPFQFWPPHCPHSAEQTWVVAVVVEHGAAVPP